MLVTADGSYTRPLCPLCKHDSGIVQYTYPDISIIRCGKCGLWRTCPRLSEAALTEYYAQTYYSEQLAASGKYERWRDDNADVWLANARLALREAQARGFGLQRPVELLDVGSGHGYFLEQCVKLGIRGRGLETSPHAVKYATEQLKLDVRQIPLDDLPAGEAYDVITLWGVLEHVPDPLLTMRQVREHLRPGGTAWVMTPNTDALERVLKGANYFNFLNKSHLTHFHRRTLKALLEEAGLRNVRRYIHWGGGARRGIGAVAQYAARVLCLGTELRFIGERPR